MIPNFYSEIDGISSLMSDFHSDIALLLWRRTCFLMADVGNPCSDLGLPLSSSISAVMWDFVSVFGPVCGYRTLIAISDIYIFFFWQRTSITMSDAFFGSGFLIRHRNSSDVGVLFSCRTSVLTSYLYPGLGFLNSFFDSGRAFWYRTSVLTSDLFSDPGFLIRHRNSFLMADFFSDIGFVFWYWTPITIPDVFSDITFLF